MSGSGSSNLTAHKKGDIFYLGKCSFQISDTDVEGENVMGWNSNKTRQAFSNRRSMRMAKQGELLEKEIEQILSRMKELGLITSFTHHEKFHFSDRHGRDFTVRKKVDELFVERSFGVTISQQSQVKARVLHNDIPTWWLPFGTKPETIQRKINLLFSEEGAR